MEFFKLMTLTIMAITMVLTLLVTRNSEHSSALVDEKPIANNKRMLTSRFLQQSTKSPRSADHCNKDNEICNNVLAGKNATCCNNKCVDLGYDDKNCGGCKKKCDVTDTCCRGECVSLVFDKRHCGECNHRCMPGGDCAFRMCDYA